MAGQERRQRCAKDNDNWTPGSRTWDRNVSLSHLEQVLLEAVQVQSSQALVQGGTAAASAPAWRGLHGASESVRGATDML